MNYSKCTKPNYEKRRLVFIIVVFLIGVVWGTIMTLIAIGAKLEAPKNFTDEVQETPIACYVPIQATEPPERMPEEEPVLPYTPEEVHALALTLSGECYDNQEQDKRNVAWVICNRVTDGRFGEGVVGVVSSTEHAIQFVGYWVQGRSISDNDKMIAEEVLAAYYAGEEPIHDYLYFTGGTGQTNNFRK